jgi:alkanesulfonate monooxygenase
MTTPLRIFTEPQQGASYDQLLAVAKTAERLGFDAFFRSDHYQAFAGDGLPGPSDAWITLAGIARETSRIRLGTLVTPITFRHPGVLAISVANVDLMSGGRVELGIGAGWNDIEHRSYAIPFPPMGERFGMLEDQLRIITALWDAPVGDLVTVDGTHHSVVDSPGLPKPAQRPHPPIIIGGGGKSKTPRLAARYADEFNLPFAPIGFFVEQRDRVRAACDAIGRDPDDIVYSAALTVACGADDVEVERRAAKAGQPAAVMRERQLGGTPDEVVTKIKAFVDAGASRMYLQVLDLDDLDHLELLAAEVMPAV